MLVKRMIWRLLGLIFSAALIFLLVNSLMYIYKLHVEYYKFIWEMEPKVFQRCLQYIYTIEMRVSKF
jgi:hypothetical protein